jgi:hypothetical protein
VKLSAIVETLEGLDEPLRENYTERELNGKKVFVLTVDGIEHAHEVKGLKSALDRTRDENKDLAARLKKAEGADYKAKYLQHALDRAASEAILAGQGDPLFLTPILRDRLRVTEDGDKVTVTVAGENGEALLNEATGQPYTAADYVKLVMRKDARYASVFKGTSESGGGSTGAAFTGAAHTKPTAGLKRSTMSPADKVAYIGEHGRGAYEALPW